MPFCVTVLEGGGRCVTGGGDIGSIALVGWGCNTGRVG